MRFKICAGFGLICLAFAGPAAAEPTMPSGIVGLLLGVAGPDVAVLEVLPGSPAAEAGIAVGDKLQTVDGEPVGPWPLAKIAAHFRGAPGSEVIATFQRGEAVPAEYRLTRRDSTARPAAAPEEAAASGEASPGMVGLRFGVTGSDVAVLEVVPGSPAGQAGIAVGDKLQTVDGRPIGSSTLTQIVARFHGPAGSAVTTTLQRGDAPPTDYRLIRRALPAPIAVAAPGQSEPSESSGVQTAREPRAARVRLTLEEVSDELLP